MKIKFMGALMVPLVFGALALKSRNAQEATPAAIGISVGLKMPAFAAVDQFGVTISSDALKGSNGTVLLFFRSADW